MSDSAIPVMIQLLYPDSAQDAWREAGADVRWWCRAFEAWLAELGEMHSPGRRKNSLIVWKRLLGERRLGPWALRKQDVQAHVRWMQAKDYRPGTISQALSMISAFYRWCSQGEAELGPRPGGSPGDNPAVGIQHPADREPKAVLTRAEMEALLGLLRRDQTSLGKRDYAFFLARLRTGVSQARLVQLKFSEVGSLLPEEAAEAVQGYLQASGRLQGMQPEEYIFVPVKQICAGQANDRRQDWVNGCCLKTDSLLFNLKNYGEKVGIPREKRTLQCLRRTAIQLRIDAGDDWEALRGFMESKSRLWDIKASFHRRPAIEAGEAAQVEVLDPPNRVMKPFRPGDGLKHGMFANHLPQEAVLAVMAEKVDGIDAELVGFRVLARGLLKLWEEAANRSEAVALLDAYSLAARRMSLVMEMEKQLSGGWEAEFEEALRQALEEVNRELREEAPPPEIVPDPQEAAPYPGAGSPERRRLEEEVAGTRVVLRNLFELALQEERIRGYVRLVELYGVSCTRLVRLLQSEARLEKDDQAEAKLIKALKGG